MNIFKLLFIPIIVLFFTACGGGGSGTVNATGNKTSSNALIISAKSFSSTSSGGNVTLVVTSPNTPDISITMDDIKLLADKYNITITSITPASVTFNDPNLTKTIQINFTYTNVSGSSNITLSDIKVSYRKIVNSKLTNSQITTNEVDKNIALQSTNSSSNTGSASNTGSSSNTGSTPNAVVANMYLAPSNFIITTDGETKTIKIVTVNSQNIGVSTHVTIEQPTNADNVDYGSFNVTSLTTNSSGIGSIVYTAPSDISGLSNRSIAVIEDSTNIKKTLQINFSQQSTNTDSNATAYEINAIVPNSIALKSDGTFVINIQKVGNPNILIANSDVKDVNISTDFGQLLTINDNNYNNSSTQTIHVTTHSLAGTAIVNISARVFDGTKDVTLTSSVPIIILSGPVAAVSLFYVSTAFDSDLGIFKDKYTIHAVDKYSNPVNSGVQLYPTLINGVKTVSYNGEISTSGSTNFKDSTASFTNNVKSSDDDHLIILPSQNGYRKDYLGGWTISRVDDNNNLTLVEDYYGENASSLHYIIGNKERLLADIVGLADIQSTTGTYLTDENGNVQFNVTYDPILVGHTLSLSAVAYDENRSGIALRSNFRGQGYSYSAENVANDGASHISTIGITILHSGGEPLVNINIVPSSVSVSPENKCSIDQSASNFTTDNNGQFTVSIITQGTPANDSEKICKVSWIPSNSSLYYEY